MRDKRRIAFLTLGLVVLAGCGASSTPASPASSPSTKPSTTATASSTPAAKPAAKKLVNADLRFPWLVGGYDEPYILAKADGFYKAAGINLTYHQGKGSATATETVGNGSDTFGVADAGTAVQLISKGEPVKILAVLPQDSPDSFVSKTPIKTPKDLIGRKIFTSAGDANLILLPAVLTKYGMTKSQLKIDLLTPAAIPATFLKSKNGVMLGFVNSNDLPAEKLDPKAYVTPYSTFGINPYGTAIITSLNEIKQHPNLVRNFVAASIKGWQAAVKDPQAAIQATLKAYPKAGTFTATKGLDITLKQLHTPATKGHPLGWTAASDWTATLALLHKYVGMKNVKPISDYYTNSFLPKSGA